jgi:hypothetical protein
MRSAAAVAPAERLTVTVCSVPSDTFPNSAPRAGVNGLVHPGGVSKDGLEDCETTTTATRKFPLVGGEGSVAEMLTPLAEACRFWTSEMAPPEAVTVKLSELVAVPPGVMTEIGPVVAPAGTVAVIWVS